MSLESAHAEYRAYQLGIQSPSGAVKKVTSTLDANQYPTYFHVPSDHSILLLDHWMCWGRTSDFKPICTKPPLR